MHRIIFSELSSSTCIRLVCLEQASMTAEEEFCFCTDICAYRAEFRFQLTYALICSAKWRMATTCRAQTRHGGFYLLPHHIAVNNGEWILNAWSSESVEADWTYVTALLKLASWHAAFERCQTNHACCWMEFHSVECEDTPDRNIQEDND